MKKVSKKLISLRSRIEKLQEDLDELKSELEDKLLYLEEDDESNESRIEKLNEDIEYIDDVYYALDSAISEIENYIEE